MISGEKGLQKRLPGSLGLLFLENFLISVSFESVSPHGQYLNPLRRRSSPILGGPENQHFWSMCLLHFLNKLWGYSLGHHSNKKIENSGFKAACRGLWKWFEKMRFGSVLNLENYAPVEENIILRFCSTPKKINLWLVLVPHFWIFGISYRRKQNT